MNVYKIEMLVIDHDELGSKDVIEVLENTKYPNRCIYPEVKKVITRDIGEWDDDHPLNMGDDKFYEELFEK